jgi:hypothetical protein
MLRLSRTPATFIFTSHLVSLKFFLSIVQGLAEGEHALANPAHRWLAEAQPAGLIAQRLGQQQGRHHQRFR